MQNGIPIIKFSFLESRNHEKNNNKNKENSSFFKTFHYAYPFIQFSAHTISIQPKSIYDIRVSQRSKTQLTTLALIAYNPINPACSNNLTTLALLLHILLRKNFLCRYGTSSCLRQELKTVIPRS